MYPELFRIFGLPIYSYGVLLVVAFFVGVLMMRQRAPKYGISPDKVWDVAFWALIYGVLGARIAFIFTEFGHFMSHPGELLQLRFAGLTSYGGVIGGALAFIIWSRRNRISTFALLDIAGGPFLIGHAIGRIGCLLNGCCYGGHCDLPWAIHVPEESGLFHPAQIYDSIFNVIGYGILVLFIEKRPLKIGQSMACALMLHSASRIIYEFWREDTTSETLLGLPITIAQSVSIIIFLVGLVLFMQLNKRGVVIKQAKA